MRNFVQAWRAYRKRVVSRVGHAFLPKFAYKPRCREFPRLSMRSRVHPAYNALTRHSTNYQVKMSSEVLTHNGAVATNSDNSTHASTSAGLARLSDSPSYYLDIITMVVKALSQLAPSREPGELVLLMESLPFDGRMPDHHRSLWQANFPSVFLDVILDRAWYASFPIDDPVGGPAFPALSEQSISALVAIPLYTAVR